jgi:Zn-dependent protease with chaperone function
LGARLALFAAAAVVALSIGATAEAKGPKKSILQSLRDGELKPVPQPPRKDDLSLAAELNSYVVESPRLESYLDGILQKLIGKARISPAPIVRVYVGADLAPDARALSADEIYLTLPLFEGKIMTTEDELAFLLAHELGHIYLGHYARGEEIAKRQAAIQNGQNGLLAAVSLASGQSGVGGARVNMLNTKQSQNAASDVLIASVVSSEFTGVISNPKWSRDQERIADKFAIDLMLEAGYNVDVVPGFLRDCFAEQQNYFTKTKAYFSKAPQQMLTGGLQNLAAGQRVNLLDQAKSAAMGGVAQLSSDWSDQERNHFHPNAEERATALSDYLREVHSGYEVDEGAPQKKPFTDVIENKVVQRSLGQNRMAYQINRQLLDGDVPGATRASAQLDASAGLLPASVVAAVEAKGGDSAKALTTLRGALGSRMAGPPSYIETASMASVVEGPKSGLAVLDTGETRFKTPNPFYKTRIETLIYSGDNARAEVVRAQCVKSTASDAVKQACQSAGKATTGATTTAAPTSPVSVSIPGVTPGSAPTVPTAPSLPSSLGGILGKVKKP